MENLLSKRVNMKRITVTQIKTLIKIVFKFVHWNDNTRKEQ